MSATPHFTAYARVVQALGLAPRHQQARLVTALGDIATAPEDTHGIIQAGTGVGKSVGLLSVAASVGKPGAPAIVLTVTNALAAQYVEKDAPDVARATGMTFTRVIGGSHYLCASSDAAAGQVPTLDDMPEFEGRNAQAHAAAWKADARRAREAWLADQCDPRNTYATEFERADHQGDDYRCPGYPDCEGGAIGGCGKRRARERAWDVDVVVSNFHVAAFQAIYDNAQMIPQADAAMVLVDEAHAMPDVLADVLTTGIGPRFGQRSNLPQKLLDLVQSLVAKHTTGIRWGGPFDTVRDVELSADDARELLRQIELAAAAKAADVEARKQTATDDDEESLGAVDTLRRWANMTLTPRDIAPMEACVYRNEDRDKRTDMVYLEVVEAQNISRAILGKRSALVSGTIPRALPRRVGHRDVVPIDVGHPFDYRASVVGFISAVEGVKNKRPTETPQIHEWRTATRLAELDAFIGDGSALVLCSAHSDVRMLTERLVPALVYRGLRVFTQPSVGGSKAAMAVAQEFKAYGPGAVLIGTASYATGLDVPGDALTRVALWTLPLGLTSHPVDQRRQALYGTYLQDRTRIAVTQSIGRLLRRTTDRGQVYLADSRFVKHLQGATGIMDRHLADIPFTVVSPVATSAASIARGA